MMNNCTNNFIKRVIGVTRTFNWTITTGGEDVSLEGRNLTLQLMEPRGSVVELPFSTTNNMVTFTWQGEEQTKIGCYSLILWENYGEEAQRRVDIHNFLELMPWSETDSGEFADLTEETIELETADFGPDIIVVDNLNSTSASDALSANMGRVLNETKQDVIQDLDAIRSGAAAGATAYQKPAAGIPKTDLASGVQASLDKADNGEFQMGTLPTQSDLDKVEYIIPSQASRTVPVPSTLLVKTNVIGYTGHDVYRYPTGISVPAGCAVRVAPNRNFLWLTNVGGGMYLLERFGDTFVNTTPNAQTIYVAVTPTAASIVLYYYDTPLVSVQERLAQKQDIIPDLATIRSGAEAGATAVQPSDLASINQALATIEAVIPSQASSSNKLTDKAYVDGAIATNTANFVGTFDTLAELQAVPNPTKNDYGFVIEQDAQGNEYYDRYKYTGSQWLFEYKVESTPFTTEQWAAIQSGITAALVSKLSALPTNEQLNATLAGKQATIDDLPTIRSGAAAGATAYQKPAAGIPKTDLASGVQESLDKADAAAPLSELQDYAKIDGYYDSMAVGVAKNIEGIDVSSKKFTFAKIDGTDGLAKINNVKGNSLAWNQLVQNGDFSKQGSWRRLATGENVTIENGELILTVDNESTSVRTAQNLKAIEGHKYFIRLSAKFVTSRTFESSVRVSLGYLLTPTQWLFYGTYLNTIIGVWNTFKTILTAGTDKSNFCLALYNVNGLTIVPEDEMHYKDVCMLDLTLMFGAGNEPSTVEEFEALFPLPYYDYNAGELLSNKTEQVKVVGVNQWDEEWVNGTSSAPTGTGNYVWSKNYIPVIPNATYYHNKDLCLYFYDANKNLLSSIVPNLVRTFTTPSSCRYILFRTISNYGATYNHDICINFSDTSRNGTYEPYKTNTIDLNLPTLTGKLNGEGESVVVFPDGMKSAGSVYDEIVGNKAIKRIGVVDLGTLTWSYITADGVFYTTGISDAKRGSLTEPTKQINAAGYVSSANTSQTSLLKAIEVNSIVHAANQCRIKDTSYSDAATFKTAMDGVMLYYELATPEEYILDNPIPDSFQSYKGGTLMQLPQNTATPTTAPHAMDVTYSIDAAGILTGLPQNYVSKESLQAMLNAMQSAGLFASYTMTYNATTKKYDFTFTANS